MRDFSGVGSHVHWTCSHTENVLAAVLVGAEQLSTMTRHGDAVTVLAFVMNGAATGFTIHGDMPPHFSVGTIGGNVQRLLPTAILRSGCWTLTVAGTFGVGDRDFGLLDSNVLVRHVDCRSVGCGE